MPARLAIDVLDFARNAMSHHGKIALSELERLQDYLADNCGELKYTIRGAVDRNGKPILRIVIRGSINLQCQRCLGELGHVLDVQKICYWQGMSMSSPVLMKMNQRMVFWRYLIWMSWR